MKKVRIVFFCAIAIMALCKSKPSFAGPEIEVPNCKETGNIQDLCLFSDGEQNIYLTKCKPGTSSCGYTYP